MKRSVEKGLSFGITSGIITTLGLLVGLNSGSHSQVIVLAGILTIAIADAFSDAMGMHMSSESSGRYTPKDIWTATISTFIFKFIFAMTFAVPVLLLELNAAVVVSVIWGLVAISILSYYVSGKEHKNPWKVIAEHVIITLIVVFVSNYVGNLISVALG
jgi:VIT1/CCC1 family predicted Fe2+/Mn2+ transporter